MHRAIAVLSGALLLACASVAPTIQTGADAEKTPDGLHKVDGVLIGTLFMQPDYVFGSYEAFLLGPTTVTYAQGARVLEMEEEDELTRIFEEVARRAISGTGRDEVYEPGPCVAIINLALVDLNIMRDSGELGAATLVMEIRDGFSREPLLRYGQRRKLAGVNLEAAFKRYSLTFQRDFNRSLPLAPPQKVVSCQERAGEGPPPDADPLGDL